MTLRLIYARPDNNINNNSNHNNNCNKHHGLVMVLGRQHYTLDEAQRVNALDYTLWSCKVWAGVAWIT